VTCVIRLVTFVIRTVAWVIRWVPCVIRLVTCVIRLVKCVVRLEACVIRLATWRLVTHVIGWVTCVTRFVTCVIRLLTHMYIHIWIYVYMYMYACMHIYAREWVILKSSIFGVYILGVDRCLWQTTAERIEHDNLHKHCVFFFFWGVCKNCIFSFLVCKCVSKKK